MKARRRCQAGSMPVPIARMKRAVREGQEEKRPASPSTPTTGSPKRRLLVLRLARLRCSRTEGGIDRIWFVPRLGSSGGGERSSAWSGSLTKPVCYVDCHWKAAQSPASRRRTQRPACAREAACNCLMAEENIESELLFRSEFHTGTNARRLAANLLDCSG